MICMQDLVAVYIVTFRRHAMFRRALASVIAQTHENLIVRVVNDDPSDREVRLLIDSVGDRRVNLFTPCERRGATRNFNLMFGEREAPFVALLEDDNWWEPTYLAHLLALLKANSSEIVAISNERVWQENEDGSWTDTGRCIWPFVDTKTHSLSIQEIAGSARLCNSGTLYRLDGRELRTPDTIPPDVSEHFRERLLPPSLMLSGAPLVNFAQTISTVRTKSGEKWGFYQVLLIGSLFIATRDAAVQSELAATLWRDCPDPISPRAVALMTAGLAVPEARALMRRAPLLSLLRFTLWLLRKPSRLSQYLRVRRTQRAELDWLVAAPLSKELASNFAHRVRNGVSV